VGIWTGWWFRGIPIFWSNCPSVSFPKAAITLELLSKLGSPCSIPFNTLDTTFNSVDVMDGGRGVSRMQVSWLVIHGVSKPSTFWWVRVWVRDCSSSITSWCQVYWSFLQHWQLHLSAKLFPVFTMVEFSFQAFPLIFLSASWILNSFQNSWKVDFLILFFWWPWKSVPQV
jgi:hypothetical protein